MRIKEFAETFGVDKRTVDYLTNVGVLHPHVLENGYRDYTEKNFEEMPNAIVAMMMDGAESVKEKYKKLEEYDENDWARLHDRLEDKKSKIDRQFDIAWDILAKKSFRR